MCVEVALVVPTVDADVDASSWLRLATGPCGHVSAFRCLKPGETFRMMRML